MTTVVLCIYMTGILPLIPHTHFLHHIKSSIRLQQSTNLFITSIFSSILSHTYHFPPTPSPQYPSTRNPTIEQTITMKLTATIAVFTFALSATAATSSCGTAQTCNAQAMNEGFDELKKGGRRSLGLTARAREWVKTTMASEENVARDADNSGKLPTVDSVVINKA
jgi:hypothetical protein